MIIFLALTISLIAGLSTVIGGFFIFLKPKNTNNFIGSALAFSGTVMILISVTDLIPQGFIYLHYKYSIIIALISLILALIIGSFISTSISEKIDKLNQSGSNLYKVGVLSMVVLMIHNLPEGILTFISSVVDLRLGLKLGLAIMMHNIPEGIAIAVPIYYATKSKKKAFKATFISGLSEPLGALLAWIFLYKYLNNTTISIILLITSALMISISINDILLETNNYSRKSMIIGVFGACLLFTINHLLFGS